MTLEERIKAIFGEQVFTIAALQTRLEDAERQNRELSAQLQKSEETDAPPEV